MALKEEEKGKNKQNDSIYGQRVNNRSITTPKREKNGKKWEKAEITRKNRR